MRKFLFVLLSISLILFSCKSQQKEEQEEPVVEEQTVEIPQETVSEPEYKDKFVVAYPADMKKVDILMASNLNAIAEAIKETKSQTVEFVGHTAKLNSAREEELAVDNAIRLIVEYLENIDALYGVNIKIENKAASDPLGSHNDISARSENRRVEITLW
ncbi:MAG: hypothetical protein P1P64_06105 [Treponemataceae bacterium]